MDGMYVVNKQYSKHQTSKRVNKATARLQHKSDGGIRRQPSQTGSLVDVFLRRSGKVFTSRVIE